MLLKKEANEMEQLRRTMGDVFVQPSRPLASSCIMVKLACNLNLLLVEKDIAIITIGPEQFVVGCKWGCESLQWAALQEDMKRDL